MKYLMLIVFMSIISSCTTLNRLDTGNSEIIIRNAQLAKIDNEVKISYRIFNNSKNRIAIIPIGLRSRLEVVGDTIFLFENIDLEKGEPAIEPNVRFSNLPFIVLINPKSFYPVAEELGGSTESIDPNKLRHLTVIFYKVENNIPMYNSYENYLKYLQEYGIPVKLGTSFEIPPPSMH